MNIERCVQPASGCINGRLMYAVSGACPTCTIRTKPYYQHQVDDSLYTRTIWPLLPACRVWIIYL